MKKLILLFAVAISAICCHKDKVQDSAMDNNGRTLLNLSISQTRTSLGEKVGDNYPTYWSEGDRIVVNGIVSECAIIDENKISASFEIPSSNLAMPYNITYPYSEGSLCAENRATVVFPSVQDFVEGSFGVGYAPMYGYCKQSSTTMNHLAGVLRLAINGSTTLSKIEIVASEDIALAGEFEVDCQTGAITAITDSTTNKIEYAVNQPLSTSETKYFHIISPYGNLGECKVIVTDSNNSTMVLKLDGSNIKPGIVREFKPFTFKANASFELEEMKAIEDDLIIPGVTDGVCGYVKYHDGTPAAGVSVSDGFSVVVTNENGFYRFENSVNPRTKYIYLSMPANAKISNNASNQIDFFQPYKIEKPRYDFTLTKIAKESEFALFVIADTHGACTQYINRVAEECVGGLRREKSKKGIPCYAIILGDIVCASTSTDSEEYNQPKYMDVMREKFAASNTNGVPTFYVMGNHDHNRLYFDTPQYSDLSTFNHYAQECYESHFGPVNYSFNRGDAHIICMRDVVWPQSSIDDKSSLGVYCSFSNEQIKWLRQDLANVPKDKKIILCVHIPLVTEYTKNESVKTVVDMIYSHNTSRNEADRPQIFSGHTHANRDYKAGSASFSYSSPVNEKTIVGNWGTGSKKTEYGFSLKCMGDGSPFGFDVYNVKGNEFTDHYFVDCTSGKSHDIDTDYVMRAYLSSDVYGGDCDGDGKVYTNNAHASHERYFRFHSSSAYDSNNNLRYDTYIHVNVFNGTPDTWSVKLYVDNVFVKNLTWYASSASNAWDNYAPEYFTWKGYGSGTKEDPWYPSNIKNSQDWWLIAYIVNEHSATSQQTTSPSCNHKWVGYVPSSNMQDIKAGNFYIEATHTEFGKSRVYRSKKIFGQNDYNGYMNYKPVNAE